VRQLRPPGYAAATTCLADDPNALVIPLGCPADTRSLADSKVDAAQPMAIA
jgi:hypothetical protein